MLIRRNQPTNTVPDEKMAEMFNKHLKDIEAFIEKQPNMDCLYISYNEVLENPAANVEKVNEFLGGAMNTMAMLEVVDTSAASTAQIVPKLKKRMERCSKFDWLSLSARQDLRII